MNNLPDMDQDDGYGPSEAKRRRKDQEFSAAGTKNAALVIFNSVRNYKDKIAVKPFLKLPSTKVYPGYFKIIKNPISLKRISKKLETGQYKDPKQIVEDLNLMFANAKTFNEPGSEIFQDACDLQKVMLAKAKQVLNYEPDHESMPGAVVAYDEDPESNDASLLDISHAESAVDSTPRESCSTPTVTGTPSGSGTPAPEKSTKKKAPSITGYVIYASEVRMSIMKENPGRTFGEISRIVGNSWAELSSELKTHYENKARIRNEAKAKDMAKNAELDSPVIQMAPSAPGVSTPVVHNGVYECHWKEKDKDKCDFQCEDPNDLLEHLTAEPTGHAWKSYWEDKEKKERIFQCLFHGCARISKNVKPFDNIPRLVQHIKEVHVDKNQPKSIPPEKRRKNFLPSENRPPPPSPVTASVAPVTQVVTITQPAATPQQPHIREMVNTGIQVEPEEHLFLDPVVPNLGHSEIYQKYIENLRPDVHHISNWQQQLNATPENTPMTADREQKIQNCTQWLSNGPGMHGTQLNALWALRNLMFQDCLTLAKKTDEYSTYS